MSAAAPHEPGGAWHAWRVRLACTLWVLHGAVATAATVQQWPQSGVQLQQSPQDNVARRGVWLPPTDASPPTPPRAPRPPAGARATRTAAVHRDRHRARQAAPRRDATARADTLARPDPPWVRALQQLLQRDESGTPQPALQALLDAHRGELLAMDDADLAQRLGWSAMRAQQPLAAIEWFEHALAIDHTQAPVRCALALALRADGRIEAAYEAVENDTTDQARALRADLAWQLAQAAQQRRDYPLQQRWLERVIAAGRDDTALRRLWAWAVYQQGEFDAAARAFAPLYERDADSDSANGLYYSLSQLGRTDEIAQRAQSGGPFALLERRGRAQSLLDLGLPGAAAALGADGLPSLAGLDDPSGRFGVALRDKDGTSGSSELQILRAPDLSVRWPTGSGSWGLDLARVTLDSGAADATTPVGSAQPGQPALSTRLDAGWEPRLRWSRQGIESWSASVGLTPTQGPVAAAPTGAVDWQHTTRDAGAGVRAWSEPVRDSMLSYVGLRDPASGQAWGRVLRSGVGAQGYRSAGGWNASANVALESVVGQHVADNSHVTAGMGLGREVALSGMRYFNVGPSLTYEHYARNLSEFTWGQGGYFSPQAFTSAGVNLAFLTDGGRAWVVRGRANLGWQSVRQDASACFPLAAPVATVASGCSGSYAASRSSGVGSSADVDLAYRLAAHWELDANVGWRSGPAYRDQLAFVGVRYTFGARSALFADDLPTVPRSMW